MLCFFWKNRFLDRKKKGLYETPQLKILNELEIANRLILKAFKILFLCLYVADLIL